MEKEREKFLLALIEKKLDNDTISFLLAQYDSQQARMDALLDRYTRLSEDFRYYYNCTNKLTHDKEVLIKLIKENKEKKQCL